MDLILRDIVFEYENRFGIRIDLTIPSTMRLAILGANGAGKSTLLKIMAGFLNARSGEIWWGQDAVHPLSPGQRPFTLVFQSYNLFDHLTVFENVAIALGSRLSFADKNRVNDMIEKVGLKDHRSVPSGILSGGQSQRAVLARSLLRPQPILLLDEPFNGIEKDWVPVLIKMIQETQKTVVFTSHQKGEIEALATHSVEIFLDSFCKMALIKGAPQPLIKSA